MEDGDCLGVSFGEAEMELEDDDGMEESMVLARSSAGRRGLTVGDMMKMPMFGVWR